MTMTKVIRISARDLQVGDVISYAHTGEFKPDKQVLSIVSRPSSVQVNYRLLQGSKTCGSVYLPNSSSVDIRARA